MNRLITDRRARGGKTVQEGFAAFFWRTGKEITLGGFEELRQPGLRLFDPVPGHFQQQVMLVLIAPGFHPLRQM